MTINLILYINSLVDKKIREATLGMQKVEEEMAFALRMENEEWVKSAEAGIAYHQQLIKEANDMRDEWKREVDRFLGRK